MPISYLEELVAEYYEEKGYFTIRNIRYGHNREVDLLCYNPKRSEQIHVEVTETPITASKLEERIKKKFYNDDIKKEVYSKHFTKGKIKKFYVVWWWKGDDAYESKSELEKTYGVEIISFEDIFGFFEKKYIKRGEKYRNKLSYALELYMTYKDGEE